MDIFIYRSLPHCYSLLLSISHKIFSVKIFWCVITANISAFNSLHDHGKYFQIKSSFGNIFVYYIMKWIWFSTIDANLTYSQLVLLYSKVTTVSVMANLVRPISVKRLLLIELIKARCPLSVHCNGDDGKPISHLSRQSLYTKHQ